MFEARLKVDVGISIPEDLREFIKEYFATCGNPQVQIQDIQEGLVHLGRSDLLPTMNHIRDNFGDLWLLREWWA